MDPELVELAQRGEGRAFDILVERYQSKLTHLVYRYVNDSDTALDLVQDIFLKIFRNLVHFKGESKFSSWIYRIAINDCIDHRRRIKIRKEQSLDAYREVGFDVAGKDANGGAEVAFMVAEQKQMIQKIMGSLPPKQKSVVVMKIYQEMTFEEIAEIMGEPISTIKSRLYKALNTLGGAFRREQFLAGSKI